MSVFKGEFELQFVLQAASHNSIADLVELIHTAAFDPKLPFTLDSSPPKIIPIDRKEKCQK